MKDYRVFYARVIRRSGSQPLHIAEIETGKRFIQSKFGTALCGVFVQLYPETGEQGKIENATCTKCRSKYGKLLRANKDSPAFREYLAAQENLSQAQQRFAEACQALYRENHPEDCQGCKTGRGRHTCGLSGLQNMLRIGS